MGPKLIKSVFCDNHQVAAVHLYSVGTSVLSGHLLIETAGAQLNVQPGYPSGKDSD